jgi:hypothetical protein
MSFFQSIINWFSKLLTGNKFNLIPIITRIFIFLVISNLSIGNQIKYKLHLGFLSVFLANMLRLTFPKDAKDKCTTANTKLIPIGVLFEQTLNSIIQYGCGSLIPKLFIFIPIIGIGLRAVTKIPILGGLIEFLYWIIGYRVGISLTTGGFKILGITIGEAKGSMCKGETDMFKKIFGFLCLIAILFIEVFSTAKDNLSPF